MKDLEDENMKVLRNDDNDDCNTLSLGSCSSIEGSGGKGYRT